MTIQAKRASAGRTFKRCNCRNSDTGRQLGARCPKLKRRNGAWSSEHGSWFYQAELPRHHDDSRRTIRRGGYTTQTEAQNELNKITDLIDVAKQRDSSDLTAVGDVIEASLRATEPLPAADHIASKLDAGITLGDMPTVADWLHTWIAGRKKLRQGSKTAYNRHIRLWLVPQLGHIRLDKLTVEHVSRMFDAIADRNDLISEARASDDPAVRESVRNMRIMGPATMQRYRATLRAALNAAIRAQKITFNPASYVELPSGKRPKALLWTPERVERWELTGQKPSRVMVWTPEPLLVRLV